MNRIEIHEKFNADGNIEIADALDYAIAKTREEFKSHSDMTKNEAKEIQQKVDDGLEEAMRELGIRTLSTDALIKLTQYGVKSGVITVKKLQEIPEAHRVINES